jgi:V/A-type H+-transporting ATPase subunit I
MAIERMMLLNLVGALEEEHEILKQLVLCENVHLNDDPKSLYDNTYIVHEYEAMMPKKECHIEDNLGELLNFYNQVEEEVNIVAKGLDIIPEVKKELLEPNYTIEKAKEELATISTEIVEKLKKVGEIQKRVEVLEAFKSKAKYIQFDNLHLEQMSRLHYFDYEIGMLSRANKIQIKRNYENISAIVLSIGHIEAAKEDIYMIVYPKAFKDETAKLLKSLNWVPLKIPEEIEGTIMEQISDVDKKIRQLKNSIMSIEQNVFKDKSEKEFLVHKIYTHLQLEKKILTLRERVIYGDNLFILNAWVTKKDKKYLEQKLADVTDKFVMITKDPKELDEEALPPTSLKNNWLVRPFEMIVKLYGLPGYFEIDPTPFLALSFCLMFGIMFGDIGQGFIYFMAGVFLYKKIPVAGGVLTRLGLFSIIFGFIYGSLFGLEHEQLPWLPSLIGSPLSTRNIPLILLMGVGLGVVILSIAYFMGILTSLREKNIEEGLFGKNGVAGYCFYLSFILIAVTIVGVIPMSPLVPVSVLLLMLAVMILKEPLTGLVTGSKTLFHKPVGEYFMESCFEGIETTLGALSNAISFIRVGAFALNHAGLFLAFLVMSDMTTNVALKIIILIVGNVLILTLEGLVVFIQGLRLQYYELFSKYFKGDGVPYEPVKMEQ